MGNSRLIIGVTDDADPQLLPIIVDANGHLQIDLLSLPSLPAGTNRIGSIGIEGYYGAAWRKAPIPFGASADYGLNWQNLSLPAGSSNQDSPALPANAFTVITSWAVKYVGTVGGTTNLEIARMDGGSGGTMRTLYTFAPLTSGRWVSLNPINIVCKSTDILRVVVNSATLNDDLYVSVNGYYYSLNL